MSNPFVRAVEAPRVRGFVVGAFIGGALVAAIAITNDEPAPPPITKVELLPSPPMVVPIQVSAPVAPVAPIAPANEPATVAPANEPSPAAEPVAETKPTAAQPFLHADCVEGDDGEEGPCRWDPGFPAISADGKTVIAMKHPDDGGRGYPGLYIEFIDTASMKVKTSVKILDPDEYDGEGTRKHQAKVEKRVAAVMKTIEAGNYRSLREIAIEDFEGDEKLLLEVEGEAMRVIETETKKAIFHKRYSAKAAYPNMKFDPEEDMCGTVETGSVQAWFDDETKTIVTNVSYAFGPSCMCGGDSKRYVHRLR